VSGYTPLFNTALDGTLYGKWPHTGIWTCLLSQMDKHGNVDMNPNLLADKIGVPVDLLMSCINDFMQPDPGSRTKDHEGRRLGLIDPEARQWGWRVLNYAKYREKARKQQHQQVATETGKDAERKRRERDVQTCPDVSGYDRPSDSYADTNTNTNTNTDSTQSALSVRIATKVTPEGEMAIALRDLGVVVRSIDPVLHGWVRDFTTQQAVDAVGIARIRKPHPEAIPANYLDKILRQPIRPPPSAVDRVTWRPPTDEECA
jgi:hypothetical protein